MDEKTVRSELEKYCYEVGLPDELFLSAHAGRSALARDDRSGSARTLFRTPCRGPRIFFLLPALALGTISWVFSSLTVEVSSDELVWHFGPGVWRKTIFRSEIESATAVRNKWWWLGWGIHLTPRTWLYNVSGLDAVEIALRNGKTLRIGSDQARQLVDPLIQLIDLDIAEPRLAFHGLRALVLIGRANGLAEFPGL